MTKQPSTERTMYYGKGDVWVFRTYAKPLTVTPIPESQFSQRDNIIFGMNIKIAVSGEQFLPSFTEGDNSLVVATDSMKNFILRHAGQYEGASIEGFLEFVSRKFLEKYPQMTGIRIWADQVPFENLPVPHAEGEMGPSDLVFRQSRNEHASAMVEVVRTEKGIELVDHAGGISDLKLIKVKGSSFSGYVKDEYTTLPETSDRPLFIFLDIGWEYNEPSDALDADRGSYIAWEQVRDIAVTVFHEENSPSIQNLIYKIGYRVLERFPQMKKVWFESNNRTWDTVLEETVHPDGKVFTEPRPPYGFQGFSMSREDLEKEKSEK